MSDAKSKIERLNAEYSALREKMEANLKSLIAEAHALAGTKVEVYGESEYDDNNYYTLMKCTAIGKTSVDLSLASLDEVDADEVASFANEVKSGKIDKDSVEEAAEERFEYSSDFVIAVIENNLNPHDLRAGLQILLDIPSDFQHLLE